LGICPYVSFFWRARSRNLFSLLNYWLRAGTGLFHLETRDRRGKKMPLKEDFWQKNIFKKCKACSVLPRK